MNALPVARRNLTIRSLRYVWRGAACALWVSACSAYDADLLRGQTGDSVAVDGGDDSAVAGKASSEAGRGGRSGGAGNAGQSASAGRRGGAGRSAQRESAAADASTMPSQSMAGSRAVEDAGRNASADAAVADAGVAFCVADSGSNYCGALPALPSAPVIDGVLECGLSSLAIQPEGWKGADKPKRTASYAAAWRSDGLYLYVEVHGAGIQPHATSEEIYCGDGVELFVDADADVEDGGGYDASGTMQFVVAAPATRGAAIDAKRFVQGVSKGPWTSKTLQTKRLSDGYSLEVFIGGADINLSKWAPKMRLGFSVGIDVAAPPSAAAAGCSGRAGVFFLKVSDTSGGCGGQPWCDAGAFCRALLVTAK
jgi:hypothetical protein